MGTNVSMGAAAPSSGRYNQGPNIPRVFNLKTETVFSPKYLFQVPKYTTSHLWWR